MTTRTTIGIHIFRRDLRLADNFAVSQLATHVDRIVGVFILNDQQIKPKKNPYFSIAAFKFMLESLVALQDLAPICILHGDDEHIVTQLIRQIRPTHISFTPDYTPFAKKRDARIRQLCATHSVTCLMPEEDIALHAPGKLKAYKVFTPYYRQAARLRVRQPIRLTTAIRNKFYKPSGLRTVNCRAMIGECTTQLRRQGTDPALVQHGGHEQAARLLRQFATRATAYKRARDYMAADQTSHLSAHLKFGTISPATVWHAVPVEMFRRQLHWRDFYLQMVHYFPTVLGQNFRHRVAWRNNKAHFMAWCAGRTGVAIVDAAMHQLNKSAWIHNRARMIVAAYLTKILHIDWRWGERYFASRLVDYDPANNNGGWQWSAGTGADAQPYFRIFNPETQRATYDADFEYCRRWLPAAYLAEIQSGKIVPIVDYKREREIALRLIK